MDQQPPRLQAHWRSLAYAFWLAAVYFAAAGFSAESVLGFVTLGILALLLRAVETRSVGARRPYYRLALGSAALALLLLWTAAEGRASGWLPFAFWLGTSGLGLVWTVYSVRDRATS